MLQLPIYQVGDFVAVQSDDGPASREVSGTIVARTWDGIRGWHVYTIEVPLVHEYEPPELLTVREDEICGLGY